MDTTPVVGVAQPTRSRAPMSIERGLVGFGVAAKALIILWSGTVFTFVTWAARAVIRLARATRRISTRIRSRCCASSSRRIATASLSLIVSFMWLLLGYGRRWYSALALHWFPARWHILDAALVQGEPVGRDTQCVAQAE